ncbi:YAE1-like protein, partial [Mya arenaria]
MCDDFDDSGDESIVNALFWTKTTNSVKNDGYRNGLEAGQEGSLQAGFNFGFSLGATQLFKLAQLRGKI